MDDEETPGGVEILQLALGEDHPCLALLIVEICLSHVELIDLGDGWHSGDLTRMDGQS